jgi:hypothetical protein
MFPNQATDLTVRIIEITEKPGMRNTSADTGRYQSGVDPVQTQITFVGDSFDRMEISRIIRATGDAIPAADAFR